MAKYEINNIQFNTKTALTDHTQDILHKYDLFESLNVDDYHFVLELLRKHPNSVEKIGCGVERIFAGPDQYGRRCFYLRRHDGTETEFSYLHCITTKKPLTDFKAACRTAIKEDIDNFKSEYFKVNSDENGQIRCPLSNTMVTTFNCHVDHAPPNTFENIVNDWVKENSIDIPNIEIGGYEDGQMVKSFKEKKYSDSFRKFHHVRMNLRITSKHANLSQKRNRM